MFKEQIIKNGQIDFYTFLFFFKRQESSSTIISISTGPFFEFEKVIGMEVPLY